MSNSVQLSHREKGTSAAAWHRSDIRPESCPWPLGSVPAAWSALPPSAAHPIICLPAVCSRHGDAQTVPSQDLCTFFKMTGKCKELLFMHVIPTDMYYIRKCLNSSLKSRNIINKWKFSYPLLYFILPKMLGSKCDCIWKKKKDNQDTFKYFNALENNSKISLCHVNITNFMRVNFIFQSKNNLR